MEYREFLTDAAILTPPTAMLIFGIPLSDWVLVMSFVLLGMAIARHAYLFWKGYKEWREHKKPYKSRMNY